jgi:SAM-dependent methyltransferase
MRRVDDAARLYRAMAPGPFPGEAELLRHAFAAAQGPWLDIGGGTGRLVPALRGLGGAAVAADADAGWLALARQAGALAAEADMCALPFAADAFGGAVAGMLSLNYAGSEARFRTALREAARVLRPGALLVADIALAWSPRRLQGIAEEHRDGEGRFAFRYLDMLAESDAGATLATELTLSDSASSATLRADLFVPRVGALAALARSAGLALLRLHPPYDHGEATLAPPGDCLRAVAVLRRG